MSLGKISRALCISLIANSPSPLTEQQLGDMTIRFGIVRIAAHRFMPRCQCAGARPSARDRYRLPRRTTPRFALPRGCYAALKSVLRLILEGKGLKPFAVGQRIIGFQRQNWPSSKSCGSSSSFGFARISACAKRVRFTAFSAKATAR